MVERAEASGRRALVVVHEPGEEPTVVGRRLEERGYRLHRHLLVPDPAHPERFNPLPPADGIDLLLVMGSVHSVYDTATIGAWIGHELDLIRACHRRGTPVLGICFGGQALAAALGGRVERAPRPEVGWFAVEQAGGAPDGAPGAGCWFEWHHDRFEPPAEAEVLAVTDVGPQLFRCGRSVGTQFHPEVDADHVAGWLADTTDDYLAEVGTTRQRMLDDTARLAGPNDARCRALVDWFCDEVAV